MATTPFKHSRLDTHNPRAFRILDLLPSRNLKGDIRCELHHCTGDGKIQYEALSYAWGAPEPKINILINGSNVLGVTKNCYDALFHLRRRYHRRALWVDAICIDQNENEESTRERNQQVKAMSGTYTRAKKVIVWLGCSESEDDTKMMLFRLFLVAIAMRITGKVKSIMPPFSITKRTNPAIERIDQCLINRIREYVPCLSAFRTVELKTVF